MVVFKRVGLLCLLSVCFASCYRHSEATLFPPVAEPGTLGCDTMAVSYSRSISPILTTNCAKVGCHASAAPTGGYTLDNYRGVRSIVMSGRFIGAITHTTGYAFMPKDAIMLDQCEIGQIKSWVNQGALNN